MYMYMYNKSEISYARIINPKTNRLVNINSKIGKRVIKEYYNALKIYESKKRGGAEQGRNSGAQSNLWPGWWNKTVPFVAIPKADEAPTDMLCKWLTHSEARIVRGILPTDTPKDVLRKYCEQTHLNMNNEHLDQMRFILKSPEWEKEKKTYELPPNITMVNYVIKVVGYYIFNQNYEEENAIRLLHN